MAQQMTPMPVQYITEEDGRRIGVVLRWEDYLRLQGASSVDMLSGLSKSELLALAHSKLAPERQSRLDDLLAKQEESGLTEEESDELDSLLAQIDHLNILKARALLTLQQLQESIAAAGT